MKRVALIAGFILVAAWAWMVGQHDNAVLAGPQEQSFDSMAGAPKRYSDRWRAAVAIDDARTSSDEHRSCE